MALDEAPEPSGAIDPETGCVIAPPFLDDAGRWVEWIPWSEA